MIRVGFAISVDAHWLGGINYYRNLITALYDDPDRSIEVVLLTGLDASDDHFKGFPKLEIIRSAIFDRHSVAGRTRKLVQKLMRRDLVLDRLLIRHKIDVLSHSGAIGKGAKTPAISWIPDFQHLHLPTLFSKKDSADRTRWFRRECQASQIVVLSSATAQRDLVELFPWAEARSEVLQFVPNIDVLEKIPALAAIEQRYGFSGPYMYLPNQYWAHKNHAIVVEALALLRQAGRPIKVISTGSPVDYRHPNFYADFCERIKRLGVEDDYLPLGVVPYLDLLALMQHSVCLINPSLFEGWSTTVEESKALGKPIILSDIPVHREQDPPYSDFFAVDDAHALMQIMSRRWDESAENQGNAVDAALLAQQHRERRRLFSQRYHQIVRRAVSVGA